MRQVGGATMGDFDRSPRGRTVSLTPSEARQLRRLRVLEQRERETSNLAMLFTLIVAPFGFVVVLIMALVRAAWARVDQWLEHRSAAQYHRRRLARRASKS
jgi:hypothetical protein